MLDLTMKTIDQSIFCIYTSSKSCFTCQSSITIGSRSSNLFFGFGDSDLKAFASWSLLLVSWSPPITTLNCFSLSSVPKYGMTKL